MVQASLMQDGAPGARFQLMGRYHCERAVPRFVVRALLLLLPIRPGE